jgi:hypothetical protein
LTSSFALAKVFVLEEESPSYLSINNGMLYQVKLMRLNLARIRAFCSLVMFDVVKPVKVVRGVVSLVLML